MQNSYTAGNQTVAMATVLGDDPSEARVDARLILYRRSGTEPSRVLQLARGATISFGRSRRNTVTIDSEKVSREHALVERAQSGTITIRDLGSRNGTTVNGRKIEEATQLRTGDEIAVGDVLGVVTIAQPLAKRPQLRTRERLDEHLLAECDRSARYRRPLSLLVLEVTGKDDATDAAIDRVLATLRPMDFAAEISEETIAIVFPETDRELGQNTAGRLLELLREDASVSVRAGLACIPESGRDPHELLEAAGRALVGAETTNRVRTAEQEPLELPRDLVVEHPRMKRVFELSTKVATSTLSVLITGETGVGKEVVAGTVHQYSPRKDKAYVRLNCACLTESLLESELFGHERGAFTGAEGRKIGYFEAAHEGTLFLDEIGEMPLSLQAKLLRVLEQKRFIRVGGTEEIEVDVRVLCATNRDLAREVEAGRFRQDLYFRISAFTVHIPPLRERASEIAPLAHAFLANSNPGTEVPQLSSKAMEALTNYAWPGNVRELRNALERATVLSAGTTITVDALPERVIASADASTARSGTDMRGTIADVEKDSIVKALEECKGNQTRAAKQLGISRRSLIYKMEKHGLKKPPASRG